MRLYQNSLALFIAREICYYGNLPYTALRLYPYRYASLQDSVQKLMRAGYVGKITDTHLKSLYLTAKGRRVLEEKLAEMGDDVYEAKVIYDKRKARRGSLLSETDLFFEQAGYWDNFHSPAEVSEILLSDHPRGDDSIRYSRYAGIWNRRESCSVIYNFGHSNRSLRESGEINIRIFSESKFVAPKKLKNAGYIPPPSMLVLGTSIRVLMDIVGQSVRYKTMPKTHKNFIKQSGVFHVGGSQKNISENAQFFPLSRAVFPILRLLEEPEYREYIFGLERSFAKEYEVINLLDGLIYPWVTALTQEELFQKPRLILCYEWLEDAVREVFRESSEIFPTYVQIVDSAKYEAYFHDSSSENPLTDYYLLGE